MRNPVSGSTYVDQSTEEMIRAERALWVKISRPLVKRMTIMASDTRAHSPTAHLFRRRGTGHGAGGSRCSSSGVNTTGGVPGSGENIRARATRGGSGGAGGGGS